MIIIILIIRKIINADLSKLIEKKVGEQKANSFRDVIRVAGGKWVEDSLTSGLLYLVANKIQSELPEQMTSDFEEKGIKAEVRVKVGADQAEFFYDLVAEFQ